MFEGRLSLITLCVAGPWLSCARCGDSRWCALHVRSTAYDEAPHSAAVLLLPASDCLSVYMPFACGGVCILHWEWCPGMPCNIAWHAGAQTAPLSRFHKAADDTSCVCMCAQGLLLRALLHSCTGFLSGRHECHPMPANCVHQALHAMRCWRWRWFQPMVLVLVLPLHPTARLRPGATVRLGCMTP